MKIKEETTLSHAPDLTRQAPRSPRVQLGGYALLPRLLDKCRADIEGNIGEYHTNCAIDQEFLTFAGVEYSELRVQLEEGKKDGEILQWIQENYPGQVTDANKQRVFTILNETFRPVTR